MSPTVGDAQDEKEVDFMPKNMKTILTWAVFAFLVFAILTAPERAADIVQAAWDVLWGGVQSIVRFFESLTS